MNTASRGLLALALIATLAALPACKKAQDAAVAAALEKATGAKVDKNGNAVTFKTDKGEMKVVTAEDAGSVPLPAGFPGDVYLPGDHKIASAMDLAGSLMVNLTTPAAMSAVYADADKAMQAGGWKRELAMQADDSSTLAYSKDKRQAFYQLVNADGGGTQLTVRTGNDG